MFRRWEKHAHEQAVCVEAALSKVRLMQNDMSNLSLDALVTLKHELSGGDEAAVTRRLLGWGLWLVLTHACVSATSFAVQSMLTTVTCD